MFLITWGLVLGIFGGQGASSREVEIGFAVVISITVTAWLVGPLGARLRWWPSVFAYALWGGSASFLVVGLLGLVFAGAD